MNISEILDTAELDRLVRAHYVSRVVSPDGRFVLYNYSEKATYERCWTPETRHCRGLVVRASNGAVAAWPFDKFHNVGELPETSLASLAARPGPIEATDKLDGSMVALWYDHEAGDWVCATRGSFTSTQALAARRWLTERSTDFHEWPRYHTLMCEWTAPDNRVVLKYERPELVLIGARYLLSGADLAYDSLRIISDVTGLRVVPAVAAPSLEALVDQAKTMQGCEGWVIRWPGGFRVKVKTADYVRLHRLFTGFSAQRVYETMQTADADRYIAELPDELQAEARAIEAAIHSEMRAHLERVDDLWLRLSPKLAEGRKAFALAVQTEAPATYRPMLFKRADGKFVGLDLLKLVDPNALAVTQ